MDEQPRFDSRELRQVLGAFVTGVTVVTTVDAQGRFHGLTCNSFSSVSLEPPLVLWSQATKAPSHPVFREVPHFAVNILAEDQIALSKRFASSGQDKFAGLEHDIGFAGLPVLRGCSAWLECKVVSKLPGGDHAIFVGEVQTIRRTPRRPLVFGGGQYLVADPHDLGSPPAGVAFEGQGQLNAVRWGARAMARLSKEFDQTMALSVWGNHGPTVTAWEPGSSPVSGTLPMGLILPVTSTATGLAFAANLPTAATDPFVSAELAAAVDGVSDSPTTPRSWQQAIAHTRQTGLARRAPGRFYGDQVLIHALSAPILDASGCAVLVMTAIGDAQQFSAEFGTPFAAALKATVESLSRRMGYVAESDARDESRPTLVSAL
jgi:flavin reductase (DIM6/NTAB) family NADH-FMN oxidoreductase RutF